MSLGPPAAQRPDKDRVGAICQALRRAIVERALVPGDRLPEDALGERFGVSRTIARQALGQLAAEGLVELRRNRMAVVATPSWEEARDTFDVRLGLERLVVERLAGRLTPEQGRALAAHIEREEAAHGGPEAASIRLATEFHLLLAEMTGSPVLVRYVGELAYRCALVLSLYSRPHSAACGIAEHRAIAAALGPAHPVAPVAEAAAARHLAAALPHVTGDYMGEHWLASFALLALDGL